MLIVSNFSSTTEQAPSAVAPSAAIKAAALMEDKMDLDAYAICKNRNSSI